MTQDLQLWLANGWVHSHVTSRQEIEHLFGIVDNVRLDLDAEVTNDTRFQVAYRGILALCTVMVAISGYRVGRDLHHYRSIAAIPLVLGSEYAMTAKFLEQCRKKRNELAYTLSGVATDTDVHDLIATFRELETTVRAWAVRTAPEMLEGLSE